MENVYRKSIEKHGNCLKKLIAIEEMSELTKELIKEYRNESSRDNLIEELVDVQIMIDQLKIIYEEDKMLYESIYNYKIMGIKNAR